MTAPVATGAERPAATHAEPGHVPPALTLEGWYVHHTLYSIDRADLRALPAAERHAAAEALRGTLERLAAPSDGGWTAPIQLVGSSADLMLVQFRPTLDALGDAQRAVLAEPLTDALRRTYDFLSVTEAGMYSVAVRAAKTTAARGGTVGDAEYQATLAELLEAERRSPHVQKRLYPPAPTDAMPYACFYPMSKKREAGQNWYTLSLEERSRLMWEHGKSGRRYAGKVFQVVTGAVGLDAWEWGVTLFAADPLEFKRIVTEMRFDEVSAKYGEFGAFYVGRVVTPAAWVAAIAG
jgi:hydrogen peroxide-dependent heme synthase